MNKQQIRKAVSRLREAIATAPAPDYMQVALKHLRAEGLECSAFDSLPDSTVIVLQKGKEPAVLTDEEGNILCFR